MKLAEGLLLSNYKKKTRAKLVGKATTGLPFE